MKKTVLETPVFLLSLDLIYFTLALYDVSSELDHSYLGLVVTYVARYMTCSQLFSLKINKTKKYNTGGVGRG